MDTYTKANLEAALQAIASMIERSEKAQAKFAQGTSQHTLLQNRIDALRIASALITQEAGNSNVSIDFTKEALENARAPIASLISKSEKAQGKLAEGTWQHTMLAGTLKALYTAAPLLSVAIEQAE